MRKIIVFENTLPVTFLLMTSVLCGFQGTDVQYPCSDRQRLKHCSRWNLHYMTRGSPGFVRPSGSPELQVRLLSKNHNFITYLLTYFMERSPSWEANWFCSWSRNSPHFWNPKVHHRPHKYPPPDPILSQLYPVPTTPSQFLKIHLKIILPSTYGSPQWSISLFCLQRKHLALWVFLNMGFHGEALLAPRPTPKLEDHPLSAVHDCLFSLFAATLHIGGRSSIRKETKVWTEFNNENGNRIPW